MNLSPEWVQEFEVHALFATHWSQIGKIDASDFEIMELARNSDYIVFTHDLDFGTALALTKASKPSVIQVRTQNVTIPYLSPVIIPTIQRYAELLIKGALIVIDEEKNRVRILPI